jgi:hypothetical protein
VVEDNPDDVAVLQQGCPHQYLFDVTKVNYVDNVAPDCIGLTPSQGSSSLQLNTTPPVVEELLLGGEACSSYFLLWYDVLTRCYVIINTDINIYLTGNETHH